MSEQFVLSVLVANHAGVLARISSLFSRRGFNIDSLAVSATDNYEVSRITIVVNGDDYVLDQIKKQLLKLEEVFLVERLMPDESLFRELLLLKVSSKPDERAIIKETAEIFRAKIIDLNPGAITLELTGESTKINAFIDIMRPHGILEMCRTGITAIGRGEKTIYNK